jgi:E3 ubiquitin-protein ligase BRE1
MQQRLVADESLLDQLRLGNQNFKELITNEARQEVEVLRAQMHRKDLDLVRVRAQRDEYTDDNTERKAKEIEKLKHGEEMESLAKSRAERIGSLMSEVRRLKGCLGASDGSRGYLAFLNGAGGIDGDYVKDLEQKLEAIGRPDNLEASESQGKGESKPDVKVEVVEQNGMPGTEDPSHATSELASLRREKGILELKVSESDAVSVVLICASYSLRL